MPEPIRLSSHPGLSSAGNVVGMGQRGAAFNPWAFMGMGNSPMGAMQYPVQPDEATANQYLEPFGFHAQQPTQNAFFPEPGSDNFFGRHPRLTRGIEGGIMGAAFTEPSQSVGQGISNVARSIMGIPMFKHELAAQQISAPFHGADMMATLMQRKAMSDYYSGRGNYYDSEADIQQNRINETARHNQATEANAANRNQSYGIIANAAQTRAKGFGAGSSYSRNAELGKAIQGENDRRATQNMPPMNPLEESMFWSKKSAEIAGQQAAATGFSGTTARAGAGIAAGTVVPKTDEDQARILRGNTAQAEKEYNSYNSDIDRTYTQIGIDPPDEVKSERNKRMMALQQAQRAESDFQKQSSSRQKRNKLPEQSRSKGKWNPTTGKYE